MSTEKKQRVLVVDDERLNRKVLSALLEQQHDVVLAKSGQQALDRLKADPNIDLILLDVVMPEMNGHETLRRIKQREETRDIPVVFITALNSVDDEEQGLMLGAADYISKPFRPAIVKLRVENHLRFVHQRKLLENLAGRDGLTEINNRRTFDELLRKEWRRAERSGLPLSIAMVDVDFFKFFNDNYGHARGDQVLRSVAKTMSWGLRRPADTVARYGGEEFVLMFPETHAEGAESLTNMLRESIVALGIPHAYSDAADFVTVSIGGATTLHEDEDAASLLETADRKLYEAKSRGRNRVVWARSAS